MTSFRSLTFALALLLAGLAPVPVLADTAPPARQTPAESAYVPGGIYQVMATSAGVLIGVTAMSLFIDGWVVDLFSSSSGITVTEAVELVQDLESYGGLEAAAILLSGLAGGLAAERLYVQGEHLIPSAVAALEDAFRPPFDAAAHAWSVGSGWAQERYGDGRDWVQARSRELWDRWQMLMEDMTPPAARPGAGF